MIRNAVVVILGIAMWVATAVFLVVVVVGLLDGSPDEPEPSRYVYEYEGYDTPYPERGWP